MTTVLELEVPAAEFAGETAFERVPELRVQFAGVIGDGPPLVWVAGSNRREVTAALEADPSFTVLASLTDGSQDRWLFRLAVDESVTTFQRSIASHQGAILELRGEESTWTAELLFHDRQSLSAAHDALLEAGYTIGVRRMTTLEGDISEPSALTETQYETIVTAHELGYFDVPRKITLKELAAELGVSHQALSERLRRSHAALVSGELTTQGPRTPIDR